jgi:hypothetical protein
MPVSLDFDAAHHYTEALDGIEVPITLSTGRQSVELLAKLDTAPHIASLSESTLRCLEWTSNRAGFSVSEPWLSRLQPINTRSQFRRLVSSFQRSCSLPRTPRSTGTSLAVPDWLERLRIAIVDYDRLLFVRPYQP